MEWIGDGAWHIMGTARHDFWPNSVPDTESSYPSVDVWRSLGSLALPNIFPRPSKSVEKLPIQVRPDLLDRFYHRFSRFFR